MNGLYYEPRSFWSIALRASNTEVQRIQLPKKHFFNGERHPIEIRRIALAMINNTVTGTPPEVSAEGAVIGAGATSSVLSRVGFRVSVPQRYHFNKKFIIDGTLAPRPTGQPSIGGIASSLWGQCALKLDKPLIVPRNGAVEWQMSAYTPWQGNAGTNPEVNQDEPTDAWLCYQEDVPLIFSGTSRVRKIKLLPFTGDARPTEECWPYFPDSYGDGSTVSGGIETTDNWWPSESNFPAGGRAGSDSRSTSFRGQESARSGSSSITGLRTYINQIDYDTSFAQNAFATPATPTPLSMRVGTRIRTAGSGSQTWWWRPGAPLCLVFDQITPAVVYELARPFTLGPGEQLDVEMEIPPTVVGIGETTYAPTVFQIGISFNGFAAIEG